MSKQKYMYKTTIDDLQRQKEIAEYDSLSSELSLINIALARCIDNRFVTELPQALERLREFLGKLDARHLELFRRPLYILHSILVTRMYYNRDFPSPMYKYPLEEMRTYSTTEAEFRNLYAIYMDAIESSLVQEA